MSYRRRDRLLLLLLLNNNKDGAQIAKYLHWQEFLLQFAIQIICQQLSVKSEIRKETFSAHKDMLKLNICWSRIQFILLKCTSVRPAVVPSVLVNHV